MDLTIAPMNHSLTTTFRVFFPFAFGYFLSYLFRVVNAVIAPDLVADLGVGPSALGLLTSTYFIAFASSQLPLGVLLDRFGPRKTEAFLLILAGIGALVFAGSDTLSGLILGRALIGLGVSACLMAAFKAYVLWFSEEQWPLINGFQMAAGGMGALVAFAGQWAIGAVVELWPIGADGRYAMAGYQAGFAVMLGAQVLCLVWFFIATIRKRG